MRETCRLITGVILVCLLTLAPPAVGSSQEVEPDKTAYELHCALCHGDDGTPVHALEKVVNMKVPNLGSEHVQDLSDSQIRKVILEGKGKMNPVQTIHEDEIPGVIAFLRTLETD